VSRTTILALAVVLAGCASRPARVPAPLPQLSAMREYVIPWQDAFPSDVAVDSVGRVWFTDRLTHVVGMLDPATEEFRRYPVPSEKSAPYGLIAAPDGSLWFCESRQPRLGRIDPATGVITEHVIADAPGGLHLLTWREGEIWFSMREARAFGRYDPRTGASMVYRLEAERPYSVAATREAVWLSSYGAFRLLEVDPGSGAVRVHDLASTPEAVATAVSSNPVVRPAPRGFGGEVRRIAAASDGAIWFTDFGRSRVVRYDAATGELTMFASFERRSEPYGLAVTGAGHVWYSERGAERITVLDPARDERKRVQVIGAPTHARHIVVDERRGRIWLPLSDVGRIGLIEYR
jgi:virginiamycin B lyase